MAVGLNSVREICARCPLAIDEDLLQDLAQYKNHKDKGNFHGNCLGVGNKGGMSVKLKRNLCPTTPLVKDEELLCNLAPYKNHEGNG